MLLKSNLKGDTYYLKGNASMLIWAKPKTELMSLKTVF